MQSFAGPWIPVSQQIIDDAKAFTDAMCNFERHPIYNVGEESSICRCGRVTYPQGWIPVESWFPENLWE